MRAAFALFLLLVLILTSAWTSPARKIGSMAKTMSRKEQERCLPRDPHIKLP